MTIPGNQTGSRLGAGGWITIVVLLGFLVGAIAYAIYGWNHVGAVGIPAIGWAFLIAGIVVTVLLGGGLMALMFYSSRKGRDL
jgi:hypothetical protein